MNTIPRLLRLVAPFRWWLLLAVVLSFATLGASVGLMAMSAYLISKAALVTSVADVAVVSAFVRLFAIARAVLRYAERYIIHLATFRILARLRTWFYTAIEPLAPAALQAYHSGDLFARLGADIEQLQDFYIRAVVPPMAAALVVLLASVVVGSFGPGLGVALCGFLLLTGVILPLVTRTISRGPAAAVAAARSDLTVTVADGVRGDADLLAFGRQGAHLQRIADQTDTLHRLQERLALIRAGSAGLGALFSGLAGVTLLGLAIPLVSGGQLPGEFLALLPLTAIASFEAVQPLSAAMQHTQSGQAAARRVFALIDAPPVVHEPHSAQPLPTTFDLAVCDLTFGYGDGAPVLERLSFHVPAGGRLSVTGPSGAGKTTLANLLLRFWDYHQGSISIGGRELRTLTPDDARSLWSVVSQQTYLFNSTLRDNLLLAKDDATDDELRRVCEQAHLNDLLERLPDGLDTLVGEDGMRLSGGERQRVALARAMLRDGPMLLLDEATASLDPVTEGHIRAAIDRFAAGRTTLVLSHAASGPQVHLAGALAQAI